MPNISTTPIRSIIHNNLFSASLTAAGFTDAHIEQMLKNFQIAMNAAIIEDILLALPTNERQQLQDTLSQQPVTSENVTKTLSDACSKTKPPLDADTIADKAKKRAIEKFWSKLSVQMTDTQKQAIAAVYQKEIESNPKIADALSDLLLVQSDNVLFRQSRNVRFG